MTREEAALKLTLHLHALGMLMPEDWLKENGEGSELQEAFRIALDVLKGEEISSAFNEAAITKLMARYLGTTPERLVELVQADKDGAACD